MVKSNKMEILFCGSFKFFDEMKKLSEELNLAGFECVLPRFSLGDFSSEEIEEIKENRKKNGLKEGEFEKIVKVKKWFYDQLRRCDVMVVFDKDGYIGLEVSGEIGAAYVLNKTVFFLEEPKDHGMKAFLKLSKNFKIIPTKELINELKSFLIKRRSFS